MAHTKRSRAAYEADLHNAAAIHVTFGTPLPPLDSHVRDDGSYVPLHKQEVRDDRGRRRLHGAFTGGWSAGYFNTVGSKDGWTPSTFVSSRTSRRKDDAKAASQRPEDYMDDEDLADAAAAQDIRTTDPFAALGASEPGQRHGVGLAGLMRNQGDTMGLKLLRKMGWKDGQGIGPKIRRKARLGLSRASHTSAEETHLFAPQDVDMIAFSRKADHKGLGFDGETRLSRMSGSRSARDPSAANAYRDDEAEIGEADEGEDEDSTTGPRLLFGSSGKNKSKQGQRGGFGVGVLNDTGSDEEDPYEMGPRISYNRVLGGDKAKRKKKMANATVSANPTLRSKPVFISKPASVAKARDKGRCLDGRPPLNGFALSRAPDETTSHLAELYSPPAIPLGWVSARLRPSTTAAATYVSTADAAKAAQLDPKSRAAILGEASLPGKSVFDYMSTSSRDRLAAASGKSNLPPAKGEIPADWARPPEKLQDRLGNLPSLDKETAVAAMSRGAGAGGPYADNEAKRRRYRLYLQSAAGFGGSPVKPPDMTDDDYLKEVQEFYGCAQLFKPMTGFMASRFTTASTGPKVSTGAGSEAVSGSEGRQTVASTKPRDPAEEAAKMGMYGRMTRLTEDFYPTRLLCKRFNVRPPAHVQPDEESGVSTATASMRSPALSVPAAANIADTQPGSRRETAAAGAMPSSGEAVKPALDPASEATRPSDEVFRAIFGDSSDEDE